MWDEIEIRLKTMDSYKKYLGTGNILIGEGNKKAKYLLIFLDTKDEALMQDSIILPKTRELYRKMLSLTKINFTDVYITSIYKLEKKLMNISKKDLEELIDVLLLQINLINPEYIFAIGGETFNILVSVGLNLDTRIKKTNIFNSIGIRYDFFSKILIPILDEEELKLAKPIDKKKIIYSILDRSI